MLAMTSSLLTKNAFLDEILDNSNEVLANSNASGANGIKKLADTSGPTVPYKSSRYLGLGGMADWKARNGVRPGKACQQNQAENPCELQTHSMEQQMYIQKKRFLL